jgi:hypothetical protein
VSNDIQWGEHACLLNISILKATLNILKYIIWFKERPDLIF